MSDSSLWQAIILGLVEGLTEFIPVSSTGHLILLSEALGFSGPPGRVFEVFIQLGAILAICLLYIHKLWGTLVRLPHDPQARHFALSVLLAFLPAACAGVLLHSYIKTVLFQPVCVAIALVTGGLVILWVERFHLREDHHHADELPLKTSFAVGCFQMLALIPGVSRSGATIIGARLIGVERRAAAEFSFFLAIPTMLGAVTFDLWKNPSLDGHDWTLLATGFFSAFFSALLVVRALLAFVSRYSYAVFGWYRIALGSAVFLCLWLTA